MGTSALHSVFAILLLVHASMSYADSLRQSLFEDTEKIMEQAKAVQASLLAPVSFGKGVDAYQKANNRYKKKQSVDRIKRDLASADNYFKKSIDTSQLANITFKSTIKARTDAIGVEAGRLSPELWKKAEKQFNSAAEALEVGSLAGARKKAETAEDTYRDAELTAIKSSYLSQIRNTIAQADKNKVKRYAPDSLTQAKALLAKAEKELSENRYDTDYPRSLAKQALYQAKHSIYLADYIRTINKDDISMEQVLLRAEDSMTQIAEALDLVAEFDRGFEVPTQNIKQSIELLLKDAYELGEVKNQLARLEEEHAESQRIALQEAQRERLRELNQLFTPQEAVVLTQGDNVIIRAVGLSFDPGSSKVNIRSQQLLKKLEKLFTVFNDHSVVVEGHTDSFGGDSQNLLLSYDRANAVREYFVVNMPGFSESNSQAKGYGETQPIANNETASGRTKNRRIDFVFMPKT